MREVKRKNWARLGKRRRSCCLRLVYLEAQLLSAGVDRRRLADTRGSGDEQCVASVLSLLRVQFSTVPVRVWTHISTLMHACKHLSLQLSTQQIDTVEIKYTKNTQDKCQNSVKNNMFNNSKYAFYKGSYF